MEYVRSAAEALEDTGLAWAVEMTRAQQDPCPIPERLLRSYAGTFAPYEVTLEAGSLFWGRPGAERTRMIALDERTFMFDGLDDFKLEMVLEGGRVTGVRAVSSGGNARMIARSAPAHTP